jgi:hypothetical protein
LILHHFDRLRSREEEKHALHRIRTFTGWYTHGLPNGRSLRQRISGLREISEFLAAVEEFFDRGVPAAEDRRRPVGPFALRGTSPGEPAGAASLASGAGLTA